MTRSLGKLHNQKLISPGQGYPQGGQARQGLPQYTCCENTLSAWEMTVDFLLNGNDCRAPPGFGPMLSQYRKVEHIFGISPPDYTFLLRGGSPGRPRVTRARGRALNQKLGTATVAASQTRRKCGAGGVTSRVRGRADVISQGSFRKPGASVLGGCGPVA